MHIVVRTIGLSLAAGLHAALYGAWKDSPHESFKPGSFMRELVIATFVGIALCFVSDLTTPFLIFLSAFTLCRIVTEFYKLFVRSDGYKDGSVTRFYVHKFVRSPITGAIGGLIVSLHMGGLKFFVLGAIACERMLTELFFKILRPGYVGGHFKSIEPVFPEWVGRRKIFVVPYALTWALFVALWVSGLKP